MNVKELLLKYPESDVYSGTDEDGTNMVIVRRKGRGCIIKAPTGKQDFFECLVYDEDGNLEEAYIE